MHYIKADITTPKGAPHIYYPDGWDPYKILVRAYDDINHTCIAELEDEEIFKKLMASGKVVELSKAESDDEIARLRPPRSEVVVVLSGRGIANKTDIENFLKTKGLKYLIRETTGATRAG